MAMTWWIWAVIGGLLFVVELAGPGFFVIFFAAGALCVALTLALLPELSLWAQLGIFSVTSVVSLLVFRKRLTAAFGQEATSSEDLLRDIATALDDIAPGGIGKAELRGTPWKARNNGAAPIGKGQRCKVQSVDGLTILIIPE